VAMYYMYIAKSEKDNIQEITQMFIKNLQSHKGLNREIILER